MGVKSSIAAMSLKAKALVICAAVAVTGGAVAAGVILSQDDSYRVLKVFELEGEAIVSREDTGDLDAYKGMNLESGDMLTVGEGSSLRLQLDDDKYLLLDENTVIELIAEGDQADSKTTIDLKEGTILNEISNPLSDNSTYEVSTPKATMAVRGTSFMVSVKKMGQNSCIVDENTFHGLVEIIILDDDGNPTGEKYYVPAGDSTTIGGKTAGDADESVENVNVIDYEDLPEIIVEYLLRSNNEGLIQLEQEILERLMRLSNPPESTTEPTTTTPTETTTVTTTSETTETTTVTTVPETSATELTTTVTAVTTVPETEATTTTATAATTKETTKTTKATTKKKKKKTTTTTEKTTKKTTTTTEATTTTEETTTTTVTTVPSRPPVIYTGTPGTTPTTVPPTPTETAPPTSDSESYSSPMPSTTFTSSPPPTEVSSDTSSDTSSVTEPAPVTDDTTSGSGDTETITSGSPMPEYPETGNADSL